eukprot:jgi/Mesvir1/8209/Mv12500-RA.1
MQTVTWALAFASVLSLAVAASSGSLPQAGVPLAEQPVAAPARAAGSDASYEEGGRPLTFLQLSDIHIDLTYTPGAEASCTRRPCCRRQSHAHHRNPAHPLASPRCDTSVRLLQSALGAAANVAPSFVLVTGDTAPHGLDGLPREEARGRVLEAINSTARVFEQILPRTPVLFALGDTDFLPEGIDPGFPHNSWLLRPVAEIWSRWLPPNARVMFELTGAYDVLVAPLVRVVVLNTQVCDVHNLYVFMENSTAATQLAWLDSVLYSARARGERVILTGHIPPGLAGDCWGTWSVRYQQLAHRYALAGVIIAHVFGHQHRGSLRLLRGPRKEAGNVAGGGTQPTTFNSSTFPAPSQVAYVCPSLSPVLGNRPSFRIFTLDQSTQGVALIQQYYLDLPQIQSQRSGPVRWQLGFSAPTSFALPDLLPSSWASLVSQLHGSVELLTNYTIIASNGDDWLAEHAALLNDHDKAARMRRDVVCGMQFVADDQLLPCMERSEETLLREISGSQMFLLTALFPFKATLAHFCRILPNMHPEDCPTGPHL